MEDPTQFTEDDQLVDAEPKGKRYRYGGYRVTPFVYNQGFINGVLRVDTDDFHDFIHGNEQKKKYYVRLKKINEEVKSLQQGIWDNEKRIEDCQQRIVQSKHRIPIIETEIAENQDGQKQFNLTIECLQKECDNINPYYNGWVAAFFILVALLFVVAEVWITADIFFNIIGLPKSTAFLIASAIACTSFAIKPAVDRIFEEPHLQGIRRNYMKTLLAVFSIMALTTLGFLGYYRNTAEAERISMRSKANAEVNATIDLGNIDSVQSNTEEIYNPVNHSAIIVVYTLLSILFAVAGAICFSIGIPVFNLQKRKKLLQQNIEQLRSQLEKLIVQLHDLRKELVEKRADEELAGLALIRLPENQLLLDRLRDIQTQELLEWEYFFQYQETAEKGWYEEGRERGKKYELADKPIFGPIDIEDSPGFQNGADNMTVEFIPGRYLHERVRKMISYNFNKKQTYNGYQD